jgi:uncharacterized membrane protein YfcA
MLLLAYVSVGTSLAIVTLTTASAAWSQHKRGSVAWNHLKIIIPGMVIGAILGVFLGRYLSSDIIQKIFAAFCLILSIRMFWQKSSRPKKPWKVLLKKPFLFLVALLAGALSGLIGIGGGAIIIPILMAMGLSMPVVSGTSAACAFPTALTGAIFSVIAGLHSGNLPAYSTGYIYWPAALIIGVISLFAASWGVKLSHRLPEKVVKKIFGGILILIAWQMAAE